MDDDNHDSFITKNNKQMTTILKSPKKITANDIFNRRISIEGLIFQLTQMNNNLYEFAYYFTFKRSRKSYRNEFYDPYEVQIPEWEFFRGIEDPVVQHCYSTGMLLHDLAHELLKRTGKDILHYRKDREGWAEAERFAPFSLISKNSKSYKRLKLYYERSLIEYIEYCYKYACVFTASKYRIPQVFKKQFLLEEAVSLRLLNSDDDIVAMLIECIGSLRQLLADFRALGVKANKTRIKRPGARN